MRWCYFMSGFYPITVIVSTTYFRAPHKHTFLPLPAIPVAGCRADMHLWQILNGASCFSTLIWVLQDGQVKVISRFGLSEI